MNMKKLTAGLLCAGALLSGCAAGNDSGKAEADAGDKDTFTVGFDAEFPPYGYKDENGEYTGFDLNWPRQWPIWKAGNW